jgi:hypothetical protein
MFTPEEFVENRVMKLSLFVITVSLFLVGCAKSKPALVEAPPSYQAAVPEAAVQVPTVVAPKLIEVNEALRRVFKAALVIDASLNPSFVAGDFNGDAIQDIAIVVRPAPGKLSELNQEFPAWLLRDAFAPHIQRSGTLRVKENEPLLAIIHGFGHNDWRDPQAMQTFLMKNAVGSGLEVHRGLEFVKANKGKRTPPVRGDLIGEIIGGSRGYLYYSVATYGWFDPKTYKGEPASGVVHPIMARR